jgi:hypothetical protein
MPGSYSQTRASRLIQVKWLVDVDGLKAFPLLSCFVDIFIDGSQDWPRRCYAREYLENWYSQAPTACLCCLVSSGRKAGRQRYETACSILHRPPPRVGSQNKD